MILMIGKVSSLYEFKLTLGSGFIKKTLHFMNNVK